MNSAIKAFPFILSLTTAAALGVIGGARLSQKIPGTKLQTAFGYFLIALAIFILIKR